MNKLLILDGNSLLHRAYYALPDWRNRSGEATAGVYGFLSMLIKTIDELKPTHLIVVFDCPEPTFRHLMYVGYQTNREKDRQISEDIWGQVEKLKIVFAKMEVPVYAVPGFEADDVVGTIATKAQGGKGSEVVVVTGDRDLMQLVTTQVQLYMPIKGITDTVLVDSAKVMERLGIKPEQVIDYKGLVGDSSDNYPGVAGIGPKTAIQLLDEFESFEKIYEFVNNAPSNPPLKFSLSVRGFAVKGGRNGGDISKNVIKKLIDGYEGGELSKRLATIKIDVPLSLDMSQCFVPGAQKIIEVLQELGYKSLVKRVGGKEDEDSTRPRLFE